jgi:hypothetical protein
VQFKWDYITTLLVIQIGPDSVGKSGLLLRPIDSVFFTIFFLGPFAFCFVSDSGEIQSWLCFGVYSSLMILRLCLMQVNCSRSSPS